MEKDSLFKQRAELHFKIDNGGANIVTEGSPVGVMFAWSLCSLAAIKRVCRLSTDEEAITIGTEMMRFAMENVGHIIEQAYRIDPEGAEKQAEGDNP